MHQNALLNDEIKQLGDSASYLSFRLDNELFATSVNHVQNIMEVSPITPVPKSPKHIKGVVNLRGNVLPVIDTKVKFGLNPVEFKKDTVIIVLEINTDGEDVQVGALVDSVDAVFEATDDEIEPPPTIGSKYKSEYITSVIRQEDHFIHMIDAGKLFAPHTGNDETEKAGNERNK